MGDSTTDSELVARVQHGDKSAFDLLVIKYQHRIVKLVSRYVREHADALDVTQDAFLKAYRALPNFRGESAFFTWLYRIAINTAKNYLVSQARRPPTTDVDADEAELTDAGVSLRDNMTPERHMLTAEIAETVERAMANLPDDLRTAIVLREIDGLSYEEIAAVMECPIGTVRSRIFRAREAIDQELRPLLEG